MALESALEDQLFGHFCGDEAMQRIKVREGEEREKSKAALQNLGRVGWEGGCESHLPFFLCGLKIREVRALKLRFEFSGVSGCEQARAGTYRFGFPEVCMWRVAFR